jgi:hypothetical protein
MNSRERILAALSCQPVDRLPFTPLLGGFGIASMPLRYQRMSRWELYADLGIDLFIRGLARGFTGWPPESFMPPSTVLPPALLPAVTQKPAVKRLPGHDIEIRTVRKGHETSVILDTPVGSLQTVWQQTPESPQLPFPIEHLLKTVEDLNI